jgi:tRNA/tmRNA/rRNA uracil-C5-methylase (TrmA/RlmC/RlmD family)
MVEHVLEPSAERVAPPWPAGAALGATDMGHVRPAAARTAKGDVAAELLRHLGGVKRPFAVRAVGGEDSPAGTLGWRTKIELAVDSTGRAGMRRARSHEVTPLESMPLAVDAIADLGLFQRHWAPGSTVTAVAPSASEALWLVDGRPAEAIRREIVTVAGEDFAYELPAAAFWQLHRAAPALLAELVLNAALGWARGESRDAHLVGSVGRARGAADGGRGHSAQLPGEAAGEADWARGDSDGTVPWGKLDGARVWDLYAGAGLFTLPLAAAGAQVTAVEGERRAVGALRANARDAGLRLGGAHAADVAAALRRGLGGGRPDVVVLDPPRAGAGVGVVQAVAAAAPERIVYVACEPAALARDLGALLRDGYELTALDAFDLFPGTHHVELVAVADRS